MSFISDFLDSFFSEGFSEAMNSKKVPLAIKLVLWLLLCTFIVAVCFLAGFSALENTGVAGAVICWVLALGFFILAAIGTYLIIKKSRRGK